MADDSLLSSLGQLARDERTHEHNTLGEAWDALSANELDAETHDALQREAEQDPFARDAYDAFRPLGSTFEANVTEAVQRNLASEALEPQHHPRPIHQRMLAFAAVLVAAFGAVFLLRSTTASTALPAYRLEVAGGVEDARSTTIATTQGEESHRLVDGSRLRLVMRPATSVSGTVEAGLHLRAPSGNIQRWPFGVSVQVDPQGAVLIESTVTGEPLQALGDTPGDWHLLAVVAHAGNLPDLQQLATGTKEDWQAMEAAITFAPAP